MECKNCLKKIEDTEIYCEDCKQKFEQENQLNELIDKNKELNHLEKTKEIDVLKPLNEEIFVSSNLKEPSTLFTCIPIPPTCFNILP